MDVLNFHTSPYPSPLVVEQYTDSGFDDETVANRTKRTWHERLEEALRGLQVWLK
jgi:hypothetical protein